MNNCKRVYLLLVILVILIPSTCFAVTVSTVTGLENAVASANGGGDKNIRIAAGTYILNGVYLRITADGVTLSGATGNRADVILDGDYVTTEIIQVLGSNVTIKDITLKKALFHPIHVYPNDHDVIGTHIKNVHIIDPGQQAIKINQNEAKTFSANFGTVEKSKIELTGAGRIEVLERNGSCYTGGVDAHHARGWSIKDNVITGFWCSAGLSEHGVHFWSFSEDTLVERNLIINCDRGIGFGLGSSGHIDGVIRNNMIYHDIGRVHSDVGIGLESASGAKVYNNTIYHEQAYPNAIEYRFSATKNVSITNNLTNKAITSREGGTAVVSSNITFAQANWFVSIAGGDLHLTSAKAKAVDSGTAVSGLLDDYDKESRPMGKGFDIGADEWTTTATGSSSVSSWLHLLFE